MSKSNSDNKKEWLFSALELYVFVVEIAWLISRPYIINAQLVWNNYQQMQLKFPDSFGLFFQIKFLLSPYSKIFFHCYNITRCGTMAVLHRIIFITVVVTQIGIATYQAFS